MKPLLRILGAVLAALICATTGGFILWHFKTTAGLFVGMGLVLLAVAIALPVPFHAGILTLKDNAVLVVPVIVGAIRGGNRATDPNADGTPKTETPAATVTVTATATTPDAGEQG